MTRWYNDKYRKKLAQPLSGNKVFFAGEATSLYFPYTMHGAFLSGVRSAYKILQIDLLTKDYL